jgi:hypothetical protein
VYNNAGVSWSNVASLTVDISASASGSDESLFFPTGGVPAGLQPLQGNDALYAQAWFNQLTQVAANNAAQAAVLNQIQANLGANLSNLLTVVSFHNLTASIDFNAYVAPWLLEYNSYAKLYYVDSSGDIYVQAISMESGNSQVASTLLLPAAYLKSLVLTL